MAWRVAKKDVQTTNGTWGALDGGRSQDAENLEERNLRQAAERERLMRQMELEEAGLGDVVGDKSSYQKGTAPPSSRWGQGEQKSSFPPNFPEAPENEGLSPFQILEKYEKIILSKINQ